MDTVFRDNGTAYLVMEFLDGVTFEEFLARRGGRITFETALRVVLPAMDAMAAVHAEGILHRDISPDNIYLTRAGKVKLIDFGAAPQRARPEKPQPFHHFERRLRARRAVSRLRNSRSMDRCLRDGCNSISRDHR